MEKSYWETAKFRIQLGAAMLIYASILVGLDLLNDFTANDTMVGAMYLTGGGLVSAGLVKKENRHQ